MKSQTKLQVVADKLCWDENLRLWLAKWMQDNPEIKPAELARMMGVSRTMLIDYVECKYFGVKDEKTGKIRNTENSKMEPALRAYRARVDGPNSESNSEFVKTVAWNQLRTAIQTAIDENAITIATGGFGRGKTRCAREFVFKKLKTSPVLIMCSANVTARYFVQKIARALNLPEYHTTPHLEDDIVARLKTHPKIIIVDQANYLSPKALGSVCYIWEESRAPVTLIGTDRLHQNFFDPRLTEDERGQLASRVAMHYPLSGLDIGTVKGICQRILGTDVATNALVKEIWQRVGGAMDKEGKDMQVANFRSLEFRLRRLVNLMKLNPDKSVEELMKLADAMLLAA